MEHLRSLFLDEATELLTDLEKGLLKLESNPADSDGIANVFRCMHSLKGSAQMFGFDSINALTHQLESIYQAIREGKQTLTPPILEVTYSCLDHLGKLLSDPMVAGTTLQLAQVHLLEEIGKLAEEENVHSTGDHVLAPVDGKGSCWYISFIPEENILQHGTNTLYLIEDL